MQTRTSSSSASTVLIVLLIVITFPFWIGIIGGAIGLIFGIFGAVIGAVAGIFGATIGMVGGAVGWIFDYDNDWPFTLWNINFVTIAVVIFTIVLITKRTRR